MYKKYVEFRNRKGMKDATVAELAGITKSTFSDWKSGRSKPKTEKLIKIAAVLEVPLEAFFDKELSNKEKLQHVMDYLSEIEAACVELCGDDDDINTVEVRNIKAELQEVIDDMK